jgi:aminoglycoside 6-adenylyltransferase
MRTQEQVLNEFDEWARENDLVRVAVLTSTRADPERETDFLSDYDIEVFVTNVEPFRKDDLWLTRFGRIMACWPLRPQSGVEGVDVTRLVLFKDGVRIDFQIFHKEKITTRVYDDNYSILIDKDGLATNLGPPTVSRHLVRRPSREEYETLVNDFWWNAHYVAKHLWRDELPFAATMLGQALRDKYLRTVIDWSIGIRHDWTVNTGIFGKKFKHYLDDETWSEYESTFASASIEENWQALFNAVVLFRRLAKLVGRSLGYEYPEQIDSEMTEYYSFIRSCMKGDGGQ